MESNGGDQANESDVVMKKEDLLGGKIGSDQANASDVVIKEEDPLEGNIGSDQANGSGVVMKKEDPLGGNIGSDQANGSDVVIKKEDPLGGNIGSDQANGSDVVMKKGDPLGGNSGDSNREDSKEDSMEMKNEDSMERNKRKIKEDNSMRGNVKKSKDEDLRDERSEAMKNEDNEVNDILDSAESEQMWPQVRELFVTLMIGERVTNVAGVFEKRNQAWGIDLLGDRENDPEITRALVLLDIERRLNEYGRVLATFNLSPVTGEQRDRLVKLGYLVSEIQETLPSNIIRELSYSPLRLKQIKDDRYAHFKPSQIKVFDEVMEAVKSGRGQCIFVNGRGRMKIDLLNAILAAVWSMDGNSIALAASSLKLASHLLVSGRTFHSLFKASIKVTEDSTLMFDTESDKAKMIRQAKIIVIDEAVFLHKLHFQALDKKFKEITKSTKMFGDKVIVLAGDFRQCLPVIRGNKKSEILKAVIDRSILHEITLSESEEDEIISDELRLMLESCLQTSPVTIPDTMCIPIDKQNRATALHDLIKFVFPSFDEKLHECAILAPRKDYVREINKMCVELMPGDMETYLSVDKCTDCTCRTECKNECPSSRDIPDLPPHRLELKPGVPLILMETIDREGLRTGTRLTLKCATDDVLVCKVEERRELAGGQEEAGGREVNIPRMQLASIHRNRHKPISEEWVRLQYPVEVAFAMTIQKSQGIMLRRAGVWLEKDVFVHGQLYTAASCVRRSEDIKFALVKRPYPPHYVTRNIVYKEMLQAPESSPST